MTVRRIAVALTAAAACLSTVLLSAGGQAPATSAQPTSVCVGVKGPAGWDTYCVSVSAVGSLT